jgi:hypothetical protein
MQMPSWHLSEQPALHTPYICARLPCRLCPQFDGRLLSHLTHLRELSVQRTGTYRHLGALSFLTQLELGLPAAVQLQRLRLPRLVLVQVGVCATHPLYSAVLGWFEYSAH